MKGALDWPVFVFVALQLLEEMRLGEPAKGATVVNADDIVVAVGGQVFSLFLVTVKRARSGTDVQVRDRLISGVVFSDIDARRVGGSCVTVGSSHVPCFYHAMRITCDDVDSCSIDIKRVYHCIIDNSPNRSKLTSVESHDVVFRVTGVEDVLVFRIEFDCLNETTVFSAVVECLHKGAGVDIPEFRCMIKTARKHIKVVVLP